MNPNPRSATSFLMVPDIWCEPPFPNVLPRAVEACSSGAHGERTHTECTPSVPIRHRAETNQIPSPACGGTVGWGYELRRLPRDFACRHPVAGSGHGPDH